MNGAPLLQARARGPFAGWGGASRVTIPLANYITPNEVWLTYLPAKHTDSRYALPASPVSPIDETPPSW